MLTVDLSICVYGVDRLDSAGTDPDSVSEQETSPEVVSQWEAELLQEVLQECLQAANEEDEDAKSHVGRSNSNSFCFVFSHVAHPLTLCLLCRTRSS